MDRLAVSTVEEKAYHSATTFYRLIERELTSPCRHLAEQDAKELKTYYQNLVHHPDWISYYRHNWARRLIGIAREILCTTDDLEILDVGCGVGTEAIFFASLRTGITVWGIDCHSPRLLTAQRRKTYYDRLLNRDLPVSFQNGDVFSIPVDRTFDLIWLMESVSHIHPAETFLEGLPDRLREGGVVGISDSNLLNPVMLLHVLRLRWKGIYSSEAILHEGGRVVRMVEERLFTPATIERMLVSMGLRTKARILGGYFPPVVGRLPAIAIQLNRIEDICQKVPGLAAVGGIYTVTAQKTGRGKTGVRDRRSG